MSTDTESDQDYPSPTIGYEPPENLPDDPEATRDALREYIRVRHANGYSFVKSGDILRDVGISNPQKVGANLRQLKREGLIEPWSTSNRTTYKITLEDDRDRDRQLRPDGGVRAIDRGIDRCRQEHPDALEQRPAYGVWCYEHESYVELYPVADGVTADE